MTIEEGVQGALNVPGWTIFTSSGLTLASFLFFRCLLPWRPGLAVVPKKRRKHSSSNQWASRTRSPSLSPLSATANVRPEPSPAAPNATTATAPTNAASACATPAAWGRTASVPRATTTPQSRTAAAGPAARAGGRPSAAAAATVCVASVCATAATLVKSGGSFASATISTASTTRENCAQVGTKKKTKVQRSLTKGFMLALGSAWLGCQGKGLHKMAAAILPWCHHLQSELLHLRATECFTFSTLLSAWNGRSTRLGLVGKRTLLSWFSSLLNIEFCVASPSSQWNLMRLKQFWAKTVRSKGNSNVTDNWVKLRDDLLCLSA